MRFALLLALLPACLTVMPVAAAPGVQHHEKIEWTWIDEPASVDARLPNVLLVGDSITRNYYPFAAQALAGRANLFLFSTSAGLGDRRLPRQIADYAAMIGKRFAVVHFNNGMHGWDYSESDYARGLPGFVAALRAALPGAKSVWASTTPVHGDTPGGATNARIDARNAAAAQGMAASGIPVDDQHALMAGRAPLYMDEVHFGPAGAEIQGKAVAASITARLTP